jgi:hypothetical protein
MISLYDREESPVNGRTRTLMHAAQMHVSRRSASEFWLISHVLSASLRIVPRRSPALRVVEGPRRAIAPRPTP